MVALLSLGSSITHALGTIVFAGFGSSISGTTLAIVGNWLFHCKVMMDGSVLLWWRNACGGFLMDKLLSDIGLPPQLRGMAYGAGHWFFNCVIWLWVPRDIGPSTSLSGWGRRRTLVLQLRNPAVGAAGRWFFDFLVHGLWFSNIVLMAVGHRGTTRRALPCRCQSRIALTGLPPSARVRTSPARGGLRQLSTGRAGSPW